MQVVSWISVSSISNLVQQVEYSAMPSPSNLCDFIDSLYH